MSWKKTYSFLVRAIQITRVCQIPCLRVSGGRSGPVAICFGLAWHRMHSQIAPDVVPELVPPHVYVLNSKCLCVATEEKNL